MSRSRRRTWDVGEAAGGDAGLNLDFSTGTLPGSMTFTRASDAWGFNSSLTLTQYATNVPRFVYDPITGANLGLLIEGPRTNGIRNSVCGGTPGVQPTNWLSGGSLGGLTRTFSTATTEDGIDCIDVRWSGTPTGTSANLLEFESRTSIAALVSQVWAATAYVRVFAGDLSNVALSIQTSEYDAGGVATGTATNTAFVPTSAPLRTQRYSHMKTLGSATAAFTNSQLRIAYTIGLAVDVTLRIGLPQLEQAAEGGWTSPIKTSTVAVARAGDTANITDPRALTDRCWIVRGRAAAFNSVSPTVQAMFQVDDGTTTNRYLMSRVAAGTIQGTSVPGPITINGASIANDADFAAAVRFALDDSALSLNGAAVVKDVAGVMPPGLSTARVGRLNVSNLHYWNSTIKSIETRATASDAELPVLSIAPIVSDTELWMKAVVANGGSVSMTRKTIVEQFIDSEKAAGTWILTDDYWPLWAENDVQALTSLKQRRLCTLVNAPVFTADRNYQFNGTTNYLNTGFACSTHAVAMTGTNVRIASYERTNVTGNFTSIGAHDSGTSNLSLRPRSGTGLTNFPNGNIISYTLAVANSQGLVSASRNGATAAECAAYQRGVSLVQGASTTFGAVLPASPIFIGCYNNLGTPTNFRGCFIGFACVGAALTPAQEVAQYNNVQAWATAVGANV